jgi:hypothetical protein
MNRVLTETIIRHVLANLAVIPSSFVDIDKSKSIMSKEFLLPEKLIFETEEGVELKNKIWGCQISVEQQELKMILGNCTQEEQLPEFALIVQLKNAPAYGLYLVYNDFVGDQIDGEALISCTLDGKAWMECQTFLQATFLAGMEQMKDIGLFWSKCIDYKEQYNMLLSFIQFHSTVYEVKDEGQEDGFSILK